MSQIRPFMHGNRRGRGRGPADEGQQPTLVETIWPRYLEGGYFDEHGYLRPEYVSRERVEPLVEAMAKADPPLTMSQMRRFFQHCRRVEMLLRQDKVAWEELRPRILFLDAAAQYAVTRRQGDKSDNKIPPLFFDFIRRNVAAVNNRADFLDGFVPHFEALVGFGATYIKRNR